MDFHFINSIYWRMFSYSNLNVFLDRQPPIEGSVKWKLKRFQNYFFLFFYFPMFFTIQVLGLFLGREGNLPQIAFDISYIAHLVQVFIKTNYFIYQIEEIRGLCISFENFHTSRHRPNFARRHLTKNVLFLQKLAKLYYTTIYMNFIFWSVSPLVIQPLMYILNKTGIIGEGEITLIPKFFPVRYPFDETTTQNRIIIAFLEVIVLTAGFIYFIPIDLFFVSAIVMICSEMEVIGKSIQTKDELEKEFGKMDLDSIEPGDERDRMNLKFFIEDHQHGLKITKKISELINPVLGVTLTNCMVCLCTLAIFITKKAKTTESLVEFCREVGGFCLVMTTSLLSLYLYSWMCGELKRGEEGIFEAAYSSGWYTKDSGYRARVLLAMGRSQRARRLRTFGIGNIGRGTFIQGLRIIYSFYNFLMNFE